MTKINALRRCLLPCITPPTNPTTASSSSTTTTGVSKKRLSTSLRDDIDDVQDSSSSSASSSSATSFSADVDSGSLSPAAAPQRPSRTMVIGTLFGRRKGHVWFCVQHDRLSLKPLLLLELSVTTNQLVHEMDSGLVRVALECPPTTRPELKSCSLKSVPVWTMFCNGRKSGFAVRRSAGEETRVMLKRLESTTVGAGVLPCGSGSGEKDLDEVLYMRASYEHVVGSSDSESFHLINPDANSAQELSIFLLRTSS